MNCPTEMKCFGYRHCELISAIFFLIAGISFIYRPSEIPPLFFDEGWNTSVARNWVELGRYCHLINGEPIAASGLSTGFPTIVPIALSFRCFGIGPMQARLPTLFFTAASIALIWYIACRLYGTGIAAGTLAVLLFMPISPDLHPLLAGRLALGEMPALCFLLAGYSCFLAKPGKWRWLKPFAVMWWGLALMCKSQVIPFLSIALLGPLFIALYRRTWATVRLFFSALIGSVAVFGLLILCQQFLLNDPAPPQTHMSSWLGSIIVLDANLRQITLKATLVLAPVWLGLFYAALRARYFYVGESAANEVALARLSLLLLSGSWFLWYVLLSIGWLRYLFPASFLGSIFISAMLYDLTGGFKIKQSMQYMTSALLHLRFRRRAFGALAAGLIILWSVPLTIALLFDYCASNRDGPAPLQVADFVNKKTPDGSKIECSEVELFFLLNRPYHYGSLDVTRILSERVAPQKNATSYDDMEGANPDYVIIGPSARWFGLYETLAKEPSFRRVAIYSRYEIFQRNRL